MISTILEEDSKEDSKEDSTVECLSVFEKISRFGPRLTLNNFDDHQDHHLDQNLIIRSEPDV